MTPLRSDAGQDHVSAAGGSSMDVRDLAADSQKLAIAMGLDTQDARYTVGRLLSDHAPAVKSIYETLLAITAKLDQVKNRKEELIALTKICTFVAAASVVVVSEEHKKRQKFRGRGSGKAAAMSTSFNNCRGNEKILRLLDVGPLQECVEALELLVETKGTRRRPLLRRSRNMTKNDIVDLNGRVFDVAREMGLAGILAVFKGVLEDIGSNPGGGGEVLNQHEVNLARQPQTAPPRAQVPALVPPCMSWHVSREGAVDTALQSLLSVGCAGKAGGRETGGSHEAWPPVVGLVGESGSGKTTVAAEVVRSAEVLEYFSDGVFWLQVNEGDGREDRLSSLMNRLATIMHDEISSKHDDDGPGSAAFGNVDDGTVYVKGLVEGGERDGRVRRRRRLRCLVVADNVCEAEVVARLVETGMWVLLTSCDIDLIRKVRGRRVVVGRLLEADANWVLRRASELPNDEPSPAGARDIVELCGRTALNLAFVGRWSTVRGSKDPKAWQDAADRIRAELQNLELTEDVGARDLSGKSRKFLRQQSTASCSTVDDGAPMPVSRIEKVFSRSLSSFCEAHDARENRRKAILRAGFRDLVSGTRDDRVRLLYLSLAVLPDGHEFSVKDAAVLLRGRSHSTRGARGTALPGGVNGDKAREEKTARKILKTLETWNIVAASSVRGQGGRKNGSFRMHKAHSTFAREILLECQDILKRAVMQWIGFLSSLDAMLYFQPFVLSRLWSAVEDVGGKGWRDGRPYETALATLENSDPLCRVCLVAVAKFRVAERDWEGASRMWRRLLAVEQQAQEPNVMYPLWELVNAAEKAGKTEEATAWRQYGFETLNLAMVKSTMIAPFESGAGGRRSRTYTSGGSKNMTDTAAVIRSLTLNMARFGPSHGAEAEMMLRRALEIEVARRGPDDMQVAATLERLGVCVRQTGRLKEAQQLLKRALSIEEAKLGDDDALVARTLFHLGVCLRLAGKLQEAEELLGRALNIETAIRGPDDVNVARVLHALGLCAKLSSSQDRLAEATELFARALAIREAKLQPDDLLVGHSLFELGVCFRQEGKVEEAEAFLRRALAMKKAHALATERNVAAATAATSGSSWSNKINKSSGGSSNKNSSEESVGPAMFQLGMCVLQGGRRLEEAEMMLRSALDLEEGRIGSGNVSVARIAFQLGVCLRREGRRQEAEEVLEGCIKTLEASLGVGHEEVVTAKDVLDSCAATE